MNLESVTIDPQSPEGCAAVKLQVLRAALDTHILQESERPIAMFYNLTRFRKCISRVQSLFPSHFLHTMAVKANPVLSMLKIANENGLGFEAASLGELSQCLKCCPDHQKIVFDSPVKTEAELRFSLSKGVYLNADNLQELDRISKMLDSEDFSKHSLNVGLRINPQIGFGTIKEMSTSGLFSKFGVAISDYKDAIYEAYASNPWLNGIHLHTGSQGMPLDLILRGIRLIVDLVVEINRRRGSQQIYFIDIGGGFPVNFDDEQDDVSASVSLDSFVKALQSTAPELFTGQFKVITEFGRFYNAKAGFIVSRVEYTKRSNGRAIALVHCGADLFVRTVWAPNKWAIRISVTDRNGLLKSGQREKQDIAGPCCHGGDIIAHERLLPLIEQNDFIICHDTGAYHYSAYSYYNSRQAPSIYGFEEPSSDGNISFILLKKGQTVDDTLQFFT